MLERATRALFWITVVGYVLWAAVGVARGLRPPDVATIFTGGGVRQAKNYLAPVAGVTTLGQFGPLAVVCLLLLRHLGTEMRTIRYLVILFGLALVRNFVYAERLALLELAIPAILVSILLSRRPKRRPALVLLPLWAPVALLIFFGSFEYFRSYSSEYVRKQSEGQSYAEFTLTRLGAYYATSPNNAILLARSDAREHDVPYYVVAGIWQFPLLGGVVSHARLAGTNIGDDYKQLLEVRANPAYNSSGALLLPVFDLGVMGGFGFWLLAGTAIGVAYRRFRVRDVRGLLLYPVLFVGLLESGRVLYWPSGRAFPSLMRGLLLGGALYRAAGGAAPATKLVQLADKGVERRSSARPIVPARVRDAGVVSEAPGEGGS